ncbi:glycosyltransferase family 2 protein [Halogeometricum limi]|nr:glycosyltransferase [Halogeometricum limi]
MLSSDRLSQLPETYRSRVETGFDATHDPDPAASLVVVTFRTARPVFESVLSALAAQTDDDFELVVVNNGVDWDIESRLRELDQQTAYVELVRNCGVTVARNLGAELALSDLLLFLDDDGVPDHRFVEAHRRAHKENDIVAVRGRVFPKSKTFYNRFQQWYNLGDESLPYLLNIEGNASIDREAYDDVSGFDEALGGRAGHEGIDLTYRLLREGYERDQIQYCPHAVIYHDYATSLVGYIHKRIVSRRHRQRLSAQRPELFEFASTYSPPPGMDPDNSRFDNLAQTLLAVVVYVGSLVLDLRDKVSND